MSSKTSSVYIDLTESISQSDSDSLSELSDYGPGMHNNGSESDQHCAEAIASSSSISSASVKVEPLSDLESNEETTTGSMNDDTLFYNGDCMLPVYKWSQSREHYPLDTLAELLITDTVTSSNICSKQPVQVCRNVSFVVDLNMLDDPSDIRADENGVWNRKGSPVAYVSKHTDKGKTRFFRRNKAPTRSNHYKITRTYYRHASSPDFTRIITVVHDHKGNIQRLAFVQYSFDRKEHKIDIQPHGNSKKKEAAFQRTKPSTVKLIKASVAENRRPLKILQEVENLQGGVMQAKLSCDLPRDRRQIYNFKSANKVKLEKQSMASGIPRTDTLAHVMSQCKETSSGSDAFIRSVEAAPEPMCVLATNQQLSDLQRFCTNSPSSVLSIDPTFNLGPFYVTPTTYHNLLVETERGNHPIVLGPVLIHQTKTFQPFHYFASTLIRLNPGLVNLKAFGTDGESELIKAFQLCFPQATRLRCTNHLRQNVKDKLRSLGVSQSVSAEFLADIFGMQRGINFESDLIDADSETSFTAALEHLKHRWNNLERSCISSCSDPQFHSWFLKYKASDIKECVLPAVRVKAGLSSTNKFTTNISESINHVIKQEVNWKENKLPVLIDHLKAITEQHDEELKKAIIGRGEWKFTTAFKHLQVPQATWFSQDSQFKENHMKKVQSCVVTSTAECSPEGDSENDSSHHLSISFESSGITTIAQSTLQNMWKKAENLVNSKNHVLTAPWLSDNKARLVKSNSSPHPHIVSTHKSNNNVYCCDDKCAMFKGFSLCSHVLAVAECNGDLKSFLDSVSGTCTPNLTAIANQGLPKGAGRKGGVPKRKRKSAVPVQSRSIRPCLLKAKTAACSSSLQQKQSGGSSDLQTSSSGILSLQHSHVAGHGRPGSLQTADNFGLQPSQATMSSSSRYVPVRDPFVTQNSLTAMAAFLSPNKVMTSGASTPSCSYSAQQRTPTSSIGLAIPDFNFASNPADQLYDLNSLFPAATTSYSPSNSVSLPASSVSQVTSHGQVVLGTGVNFNIGSPILQSPSVRPTLASAGGISRLDRNAPGPVAKPFTLKLKTKQIKVCQSCRKDYEGENDTLGLVVAHPERRLISNPITGAQFVGKESNSHYHAHMKCLKIVDSSFSGDCLVIPEDLVPKLTVYQKVYLSTCLQVPAEKINLM